MIDPQGIWVFIESALSKSQNTVLLFVHYILVFKMVACACFFDQIATPITTELLENPIPCICYAIVVLTSLPTDEWS
jgi:Mg2+/citrate symporter